VPTHAGFAETFLNVKVLAKYGPDILVGLGVTIELAALVVVTGIAGGLALALIRSLGFRVLNWLMVQVVDLFRALPPLVILVLIYFGLPNAPSGFVATWISLASVLAAFAEEIFWAGIISIPHGQWDAAKALGLRFWQIMRLVVLPQALRIAVAPLTNRTIAITKGTALASVVAVQEVLGAASSAMSNSYNPSPLLLGAGAYLLLFLPVVVLGRHIEQRYGRHANG
jgi:polar amino acid transport system permease protein